MVDLSNYPSKSVLQLLKGNGQFVILLNESDSESDIKNFLNERYILTDEQLSYIIEKI